MKEEKETDEGGKKRSVSIEKSKSGKKKDVPTAYHILIKYNNNKHNTVIFYFKKWKKYNEIQLTKNKMNLNNRKMTNHPPSPGHFQSFKSILFFC